MLSKLGIIKLIIVLLGVVMWGMFCSVLEEWYTNYKNKKNEEEKQ